MSDPAVAAPDRPVADLTVAFAPNADALRAVLDDLRAAYRAGPDALDEAVVRMVSTFGGHGPDSVAVRSVVASMLRASTSTHALTELGLLADEGLFEGVARRVGARVAPAPPRAAPVEAALMGLLEPGDGAIFDAIRPAQVVGLVRALAADPEVADQRAELASALVILATRIAGLGLDARLTERMPSLETWQSPFIALSRVVDRYAEAWVNGDDSVARCDEALDIVRRCRRQVIAFRRRKTSLGTTLHLSSSSLRMQQQLERLERLLRCTRPVDEGGDEAIARLTLDVLAAIARRSPVIEFVRHKLDLLSYLVIGHAAQKGEGYAAHSRSDLRSFARKSLFGGVIVAVFGTLKPVLSRLDLPHVWQAAVYGANYALCFVLIYLLGATLATKQPSVTASRLAAALEEGPEHEDFARLVRAIWRSQYMSFIGNIIGAGTVAVALVAVYGLVTGSDLLSVDDAKYMAKGLGLTTSGTVFFAAVAGVMLSFAGLLSGFVDNAVVFHRLGDRVRAGTGLFRAVPRRWRARLAEQVDKRTGVVIGNAVLGFLLGSAGTIGVLVGLPFDIRHIAFASAHAALAVWFDPALQTLSTVALLLASVVTIGLVNFLVSFGLTLTVAITARRVEGIRWRQQLRQVWALLRSDPWAFFVPRAEPAAAGAAEGDVEPLVEAPVDGDGAPQTAADAAPGT